MDANRKKGTADLLLLALLDEQEMHGYEIGRRLEQRSQGPLRFTLASLYETLYRLEERGLVRGRWVERATQRRRRVYQLTPSGRRELVAERAEWGRLIVALRLVAGVEPV